MNCPKCNEFILGNPTKCYKCGASLINENIKQVNQVNNTPSQSVQKNKENIIGMLLKISAEVIFVIGFIIGFSLGYEKNEDFNFKIALIIWGGSFLSCIVIMGLGEIVLLLQRLVDKNNFKEIT